VLSLVNGGRAPEDDLFAGLRGEGGAGARAAPPAHPPM
jgi:hypothetical protein